MEGLADVAREKLLQASQISDEPLVIFGLAEIRNGNLVITTKLSKNTLS